MNEPLPSVASQSDAGASNSQPDSTAAFTPAQETISDRQAVQSNPTFGRYVFLKLLGKGGMGEVHLARDTLLERTVALKLPRFQDESGIERIRFLQEAKAAAVLSHPNICQLHDVGEVEGRPYLTMAFIEGPPLSRVLKEKGALLGREAAGLVRTIAQAMQKAHDHGILHRDLKPANILIDSKGEPIVMDFGLAYRFDTDTGGERLTQKGLIIGTPAYMPPEQINAAPLGPTADVYSLGIVLFELLTGKLPFSGTLGQLIQQVELTKPPRPSSIRPDVDPVLEAICLKAMQKKPGDRYLAMAAFAKALDDYLAGIAAQIQRRSRRKLIALVAALMFFTALGVLLAINPWRSDPIEKLKAEDTSDPPSAASDTARRMALLRDHVARPVLKVQKYLKAEKPMVVSRAELPPPWVADHPGPLYLIGKGTGKGHVMDMTDQDGQAGQLMNFSLGDVTVRGAYPFFVGQIGEGARIYIEATQPLCLLACMNGGKGCDHVEYDGSHFLLPKVEVPKIEVMPISPDEKKLLRNRSLSHKVTMRFATTEYTILAKEDVQFVSSDPTIRARDFPEIHLLIELDRSRQTTARTVGDLGPPPEK